MSIQYNGQLLQLTHAGAPASLQHSDHSDREGEPRNGGERGEGETTEKERTQNQGLYTLNLVCRCLYLNLAYVHDEVLLRKVMTLL